MKRSTHRKHGQERRARRRNEARARARFAPWSTCLEDRTLLSISIVDVSLLEGNSGPVQVQGSFESSSETDYYQFQATAGRTLLFDATTANAPGSWFLYGPDGTHLAGAGLRSDFEGLLPWTGTYTLAVAGPGGTLAEPNYSFRIFDVTPPEVALGSNFGAVQSGTLAAGQSRTIEYPASAGQLVYFDNLRPGSGAAVQLIDPAGNAVYSISSALTTSDPSSAPVVLRMSGTYQVRITGTGDYKFRILALPQAAPSLSLGQVVQGGVPDFETDFYKFDGAIGQRLIYDGQGTSDSTYVYLIDPTGDVVWLSGNDARGDSTLFPLAETGTYLLGVQGRKAGASDYKFRLIDVAAAPTVAYAVGTTQSGTLNPTKEVDTYRFSLAAGQRVYLDNLGGAGDTFGAQWKIYDEAGRWQGDYLYPGASGGSGDGEFVAPRAGTYYLAIEGQGGAAAFSYSFRIHATADSEAALTLGTLKSGSISAPGEQDAYTFEGSPGQRLYLDGRAAAAGFRAALYGPAGATVLGFADLQGDRGPVTLAQAGTYRLVVDGSGDATGAYSFRLSDLDQAPTVAYAVGTRRDGTLNPTNEVDTYSFSLAAGQRAYLDNLGGAGDTFGAQWDVYGPDGRRLAGDYLYPGGGGSGDGEFDAPAAGTYYLAVAGRGGAAAFSYSFRIHATADSEAALTLGATASGSISAPGEQDAYTFEGSPGQRLYLDGRAAAAGIRAALYGPAGATVLGFADLQGDRGPVTLAQAGTYRLVVDGSGDATGAYSFRLSDLDQAVAYTAGTDRSGTLTPGRATDLYKFTAAAGQTIALDLQALTGGDVSFGAQWTLYGPSGRQLAGNWWYNGTSDTSVLAPETGTYYLAIQGGSDAASIGYAFKATVSGTGSAPTDNFGAVRSGTLAAGQVVTSTFSAAAGTRVYFDSQDRGNDPLYATLTDPDGLVFYTAYIDSSDYGPLALPKGGTYTLTIRGSNATSTGSYRFRLLNLAADSTPLTLGAATSGTTPNQEADFYRFTGAPGQRLLFDSLATGSELTYYTLFNPDGSSVSSGWAYNDDGPFTLTQAGEYYLRLDPQSATATDYAFRLIDVAAAPAMALGLDEARSATLDPGRSAHVYRFDGAAGQRVFV
uniref:pre-peptidase C-terminal domain-containing protein n=1 Tax=Paludisphaera sp. TaxID=2017432 RepID=UPI00301C8869